MSNAYSPEYSRIAAAFIGYQHIPASSKTVDGKRRLYAGAHWPDDGLPIAALFSYGPHYPALLARDGEQVGQFLLNETDYAPEDYEREEAGWRQSPYSNRRRPAFSPTTRRQLDAIKDELQRAGKAATDETVTIGDYTYRVWS